WDWGGTVIALLLGFVATRALIRFVLRLIWPGMRFRRLFGAAAVESGWRYWIIWLVEFLLFLLVLDGIFVILPAGFTLELIFAEIFSPVALLMGVTGNDIPIVADLLGNKLVLNEFVAYSKLREQYQGQLSPQGVTLATFALSGFANFASIGIQLGGIGG